MNNETKGIFQILIASLLFGLIPIFVRFGSHLGPYNLSFFRVLIAAVLLYLFSKFTKRIVISKFRYEKKKLLFFGAIHGFIILGYFIAIQFLSIASAVLLLYSAAIWIIVFSHFILKERITKRTILALVVAFFGVILVLEPSKFFIRESLVGSLSGLFAGVGFGLVYVLSKTFKKYDPYSLTYYQNIIAIPFLIPLLLIDFPKLTLNDMGLVVLLGGFTAISFVLVFSGLRKVAAQKAGVIIMLEILFPVLFASLIFSEIPSISAIVGGILIIIGFYLATTKNTEKAAEVIS